MGFKRTTEGRVFFQNFDDAPQDSQQDSPNLSKPSKPANQGPGGGAASLKAGLQAQSQGTQTQILTLLKTLNERLKATQDERNAMREELNAYKTLITGLEEKSERSELAYLSLENKLSSKGGDGKALEATQEAIRELEATRKLVFDLEDKTARANKVVETLKQEIEQTKEVGTQVIKRQKTIEDRQKEQAEKMVRGAQGYAQLTQRIMASEQKAEDLSEKLDETTAQQARLIRKVDKAIEDRARFMRKIERIEETVLQTRDSLNAKAMVLLTDQGVAGAAELDDQEINAELARLQARVDAAPSQIGPAYNDRPWWRPAMPQAIGASALVLLALAGGWLYGQSQKPDGFNIANVEMPTLFEQSTPAYEADYELGATDIPMNEAAPIEDMEWSVDTDTTAFSANDAATSAPQAEEQAVNPADDLGALDLNDPALVEKALEENPEALAAALNNLEPSKAVEETATQEETQAAEEVAVAPLAPSDTAEAPAADADLASKIDADKSLTGVLKEIETQAFAGVPEAQHDIAAVYTAGHGGVAQDYGRAAFWFEQAANNGVANAAYNLGVLNHQGLGMKPDMKGAIKWYTRAAELGHPEAQYNLGIAYIEGIGVLYDPQQAAAYFDSAANNDIMEAAYNLGLIYENGLLGDAKPDEALMWYKIAADQGSPEAQQALQQLAETLNISLDDVNKLAESMKVLNKSEAVVPAVSKPQAPVATNKASTQQAPVASSTVSKQAMTAQVQEFLMGAGLYPGPADGITGPLTADAVRAYQRQHNLETTGQITTSLLAHMLGNGEA